MIPTGVAFAASGLVGNCIGMNQVDRAKQYERVSILFSVIVTSIMLLIFWAFDYYLAALFTTDERLIQMTRTNFWALFLYIFWSTIKGVQNGVVRSLGQQKKNTLVTLAELKEPVDHFFDEVMVMADDEAVRNNRLALLNSLSSLFLGVADVSRLQG